jgi:hypothetical protein
VTRDANTGLVADAAPSDRTLLRFAPSRHGPNRGHASPPAEQGEAPPVDAWVYFDASAQEQQGTPVVFSLGAFVVDTPGMWLVCCLLLFVIFVPLYLAGRAR